MKILVKTLRDDGEFNLGLELLVGGAGLERFIAHPRIQKPGLAIAGLVEAIRPGRVQVLGNTELQYLRSLASEPMRAALRGLLAAPVPCIVVTGGMQAPAELLQLAEAGGIPVLRSSLSSGSFINRCHDFLDEHLSPEITLHGVLMDVFGVGVLHTGQSGIGKSECALDLILRGHRLVADDVVLVRQRDRELSGMGSPLTRHHMEVRGLGIINVKDLFGAASVCERKRIELVVEMVEWQRDGEYDRLGIDDSYETILGTQVPRVRLPIRPGRNVASIVEVASRNHLLKLQGHHSAREVRGFPGAPPAAQRRAPDAGRGGLMPLSILILTGQSGSGKSTAIRALEDHGYFCVDNLPTTLVEQLVQVVDAEQTCERLALVMDIRERRFLGHAPALVARLRQGPHPVRMVFLEAKQESVLRRYSETRRLHPLDRGDGLRAAVAEEHRVLAPLRELADEALDTSELSPHALRARVVQLLVGPGDSDTLRVGLMSFGFKYGVPSEADMVLDARFLPNPYFQPGLREKTGKDAPVRDFVLQTPDALTFLQHAESFLRFLLPQYQREGKRYLTVAIGCTGGRHRSVALAQELASRLAEQTVIADLRHRDLQEEAR